MSSSPPKKPGWLQKAVGIVLILATLGYVGFVTYQGGVINPDRPRNYWHVRQAMKFHALDTQQADGLFKRATHIKPVDKNRVEKGRQRVWKGINERITFHKNLASGQLQTPEKYSTQLAVFQANDLKKIPAEFLVRIPEVTDQAIYFFPARHYEILGSAQGSAEAIFKKYLARVVECKWLVSDIVFDEETQAGLLFAGREKWHLTVAVKEEPLFPNQPIMVFWRMDRQDVFGDEPSRFFRRGLGGGSYGW